LKIEDRLRQDRLQKFSRIISGNYQLRLTVIDRYSHPGCCVYDLDEDGNKTKNSVIIIRKNISTKPKDNLMLQKAVTLHELGHDLFTDSPAWKASGVDKGLANIIEDGRIEEAVSRQFPKARMYFYLANKELNGNSRSPLPVKYIHNLLLREAKRTTGIPQLTKLQHERIKEEIGSNDYHNLLKLTREAVEAKTEKEAINITIKIQSILIDIRDKKRLGEPLQEGDDSIFESGKATQKKMPNMEEDSKKLLEEILDKNEDIPDLPDVADTEPKINEDAEHVNVNQEPEPEPAQEPSLIDQIEDEINNEVEDEIAEELGILSTSFAKKDFTSYNDVLDREFPNKPIDVKPLENTAKSVAHSLRLIAEKGRKGWQNNQTKGRLHMKSVISSVANNNKRVFKNRVKPEATDLSAIILIDASGSMSGMQAKRATETAYIISKAMELNDFNSEVVQFGVTGKKLKGVKSFNQRIQYAQDDFVPLSRGSTPLFPALEGAEASMNNVRSNRKVIFVVTDGAPDVPDACERKVKELEAKGILVIGILINSYDSKKIFKHKMSCNNIIELRGKMQNAIKDILRTIKHN